MQRYYMEICHSCCVHACWPRTMVLPYIPEQDYGKGKKGFVPPHEWRVTLP